ncbi:MAG: NUDIX hydrolase, partial [Thermogutta sp.]|nr:NUDIX hydrolase [Thermogutta sp.]
MRKSYVDEPEGLSRYVIRHHGAVGILPVLADGRIVMIRNYRAAVDEWLLEIPAGTMAPGESPDRTAHRELEEETGYTAGRMLKLAEFFPSPGISDERMTLYLAGDLVPGQARPEADEEIEVAVLTQAEALAALAAGTVRDAKTMIALLWLES